MNTKFYKNFLKKINQKMRKVVCKSWIGYYKFYNINFDERKEDNILSKKWVEVFYKKDFFFCIWNWGDEKESLKNKIKWKDRYINAWR